jgi:hypothetical protein
MITDHNLEYVFLDVGLFIPPPIFLHVHLYFQNSFIVQSSKWKFEITGLNQILEFIFI